MSGTDTTFSSLDAEVSDDCQLDPAHSRIGFVARHAMVTKVHGSLDGFEGSPTLKGATRQGDIDWEFCEITKAPVGNLRAGFKGSAQINRSHSGTITGRTRLFGVIGDPVAQVRAPMLLNPEFERLGVDAVLVPIHAPTAQLADVVRGLQRIGNLDGLLVTVPHKVAVCALADRVSPTVALVGSANALRRDSDGRWHAENFDGAGFVAGLAHEGRHPSGKRVALVGAGGAGSAIAIALLEAGVAELRVADLDSARLDELRARVTSRWPDRAVFGAEPDLRGVDLAVNATPLGLRQQDDLPFTLDQLPAGATVTDIIMEPHETRLLTLAASLGHPVHHGIHMLSHQIAAYLEFFGLTS